ncbi:hypothetical protein KCP76_09225 [Salmonella enterica subsp. enterica serovar Weltevreden]|nr:hypothetical protein KCP76_09225 [Salmonella enterica subsp. enterica serovar Weltevreden]
MSITAFPPIEDAYAIRHRMRNILYLRTAYSYPYWRGLAPARPLLPRDTNSHNLLFDDALCRIAA